MHPKILIPAMFVLSTSNVYSQNFENYATCESREKELRAEFSRLEDEGDTCANTIFYSKCKNMSQEQRTSLLQSLNTKKINVRSQLSRISQICSQMRSFENDRKRQQALSAANDSQRFERNEQERHRQISRESYLNDRQIEAAVNGTRQQREMVFANQDRQKAEQDAAAQAAHEREWQASKDAAWAAAVKDQKRDLKAQAITSIIGLVTKYGVRDHVDFDAEKEEQSASQEKYEKIQSGVEKYQDGIQKLHTEARAPGLGAAVISAQQKAAWDELRDKMSDTTGALDRVSKEISSFNDGASTSSNTNVDNTFKGTPLPQNPWSDSEKPTEVTDIQPSDRSRLVTQAVGKPLSLKNNENPWLNQVARAPTPARKLSEGKDRETQQSQSPEQLSKNDLENPWSNETRPVGSAEKSSGSKTDLVGGPKVMPSQSAVMFVHPLTKQVYKIHPNETLYRDTIGAPLRVRLVNDIPNIDGDTVVSCTKTGLGIVTRECERERLSKSSSR